MHFAAFPSQSVHVHVAILVPISLYTLLVSSRLNNVSNVMGSNANSLSVQPIHQLGVVTNQGLGVCVCALFQWEETSQYLMSN